MNLTEENGGNSFSMLKESINQVEENDMLGNIRAIYFPYFIEEQDDGSWKFYNREYGPIGFNQYGTDNTDNLPLSVHLIGLIDSRKRKLSFDGQGMGDDKRIFLYNDGCRPEDSTSNLKAYLAKLSILMKLDVKT